jgi:hypothetical protein
MSRFDRLLKKYKDPSTSEFERGKARGQMLEMGRNADKHNKANNPTKHAENLEKRAHHWRSKGNGNVS